MGHSEHDIDELSLENIPGGHGEQIRPYAPEIRKVEFSSSEVEFPVVVSELVVSSVLTKYPMAHPVHCAESSTPLKTSSRSAVAV
jgi:hypothetical protein